MIGKEPACQSQPTRAGSSQNSPLATSEDYAEPPCSCLQFITEKSMYFSTGRCSGIDQGHFTEPLRVSLPPRSFWDGKRLSIELHPQFHVKSHAVNYASSSPFIIREKRRNYRDGKEVVDGQECYEHRRSQGPVCQSAVTTLWEAIFKGEIQPDFLTMRVYRCSNEYQPSRFSFLGIRHGGIPGAAEERRFPPFRHPSLHIWYQEGALHQTVQSEDPDAIRLLIQLGLPINSPDQDGLTCLMYAAKLGSCEILTLLLHAGADINALNECNGLTALMYAALADNSLMVSFLLEHGADANATDNCGWTALHYASRLRGSNTAKALLTGGYIDPNLRNFDGETALISACHEENFALCELLLQKDDVDINAVDRVDNTALFVAAQKGNSLIAALILQDRRLDWMLQGYKASAIASKNGHGRLAIWIAGSQQSFSPSNRDLPMPPARPRL